MKTVGIIGGIGPASTIEYYRQIISSYLARSTNGQYPQIIINSIDMKKMLDLIGNRELAAVSRYLAAEVQKLEAAGADFAVLASNTPHIVFDLVRELSQLPLISIVAVTGQAIAATGIKKVALLGTRFTMQGGFYAEVLSNYEIEVITPDETDQRFIHDKYMGELVNGIILDQTKAALIHMIEKMKQKNHIEGVILGGTELPLILQPGDISGIQVFDTTAIHVESIIANLISHGSNL